jgi:hypothetical protein
MRISAGELAAELPQRLSELLEMSIVESRLTKESEIAVEKFVGEKYDSPVWTARR